jgi:hypothetical protein
MRLQTDTNAANPNANLANESEQSKSRSSSRRAVQYEEESPSLMGDKRMYSDVWYRRFLRPFTGHCCWRQPAVSLYEAFQLRVLRPIGIPVEEIAGYHERFKSTHVHLSPLIGLVFTYNNFIDNLYRYGDPVEPAAILIRALFHVLPGGEIQPTHLGSSAGSHLSSGVIGKLLIEVERLRPTLEQRDQNEGKALLRRNLLQLLTTHSDYECSRKQLNADVESAELYLESLRMQDSESGAIRAKIKELDGMIVKKGRHKLKQLQSQRKEAKDGETRVKAGEEISRQQAVMDAAQKEIDSLRAQIVTSLDMKTARKALHRAQKMIELEETSRAQLAETLADSFYAYDLEFSRSSTALPMFTTSTVFLAFLWRKYDTIDSLEGYMESMVQLNALKTVPISSIKELQSPPAISTLSRTLQRKRRYKSWSAEEKASATIITISKPNTVHRPPVVPFSYVRWADYSKFPDCGETAIRNLLNQMLYNPKTGAFDHELLTELQQQFYPLMNPKVIDFYKRYPDPDKASDHAISKAWIDVVSGLNTGNAGGPTVRYRREKQQQNVASPLSNGLSVVSRLFGVQPPNEARLSEIVDHINQLRGWKVRVDTSRIKKDGFGIVELLVDKVRYELQSYRPVHFGFVQVQALVLDSAARCNYEVFRSLMRISNKPQSTRQSNVVLHFEHLAIASLFVPYYGNMKTSGVFGSCPLHYRLLFADLYQSSQQEAILGWARSRFPESSYLAGYVDRVLNYKEPTFLPQSEPIAN